MTAILLRNVSELTAKFKREVRLLLEIFLRHVYPKYSINVRRIIKDEKLQLAVYLLHTE